MQADKPFPKDYLKDRKRQAEHRVYRQLAESELPGLFIFEWKRDKKSAEIDFVVWMRGVGTFAIQVKGGSYQYRRDDDKEWYLRKSGEWEKVPSPLQQTWSGADALIHSLPRIQAITAVSCCRSCSSRTWTRTVTSRPGQTATKFTRCSERMTCPGS